ncbi:hypothetical protein GF312_22015 [Candidatus Poribacteria bacterium]|nr:hypothetical protein [Candidatus Poribacteria bacterium]
MTDEDTPGIDWEKLGSGFVKLDTDREKKLKLTNWRQEHRFDRPGLRFDVLEEDSKPVDKTLGITSRRLIRALRPIIQNAAKHGISAISVSILRTGEGMDTSYQVREIS